MTTTGDFQGFVSSATRFLFFTGKGGVGKTTLSCATAVALADSGRRVLLISTDPASNLTEVLGEDLSSTPTPLPCTPGLWAMNINPEQAATAYRERMVAPYRGVMPEAMVANIEEQLSGACTTEIAAFNEFTRYLGDPESTAEYDHVVFDTAPTGHTLRLLQLPAAWDQFLDNNTTGSSCLGPLAGLREQHAVYTRSLECLVDPARTRLALVSRPESAALAEARRTQGELVALGMTNMHLLLNGMFYTDDSDPVARAMAERQRQAVANIPAELRELPRTEIPLRPFNVTGIDAIRAVGENGKDADAAVAALQATIANGDDQWPTLSSLIDDIERQGRGVIFTMGKGGVGKTTLAAAIATGLAARGHRVHLTTTDPAAHLEQTLDGAVTNLDVSRIDPAAEIAAYTRETMANAGADLDDEGRRLLEEDLRSPCTEEIAVFRAFADKVDGGRDGFVVLDTAPTGHTLLLLDASEAYHRQVTRTQSELPEAVRQLLPRLRDPDYSKAILVTLPEATPVHEAMQLRDDLVRAGIRPYAWVVNQSLAPVAVTDPMLHARRANEHRYLTEVRETAQRIAVVPWLTREPRGLDGLRQLTNIAHNHSVLKT